MSGETTDRKEGLVEASAILGSKVTKEALRTALHDGAGEVVDAMGRGVKKAGEVLAAPAASEVDGLLPGTDLPELAGDDSITSLALRLDREADFWRALALRTLARAAWADRTSHAAGVVAALGCVGLAGIAGMEAMLGAGNAPLRSLLLGVGILSLAAGTALVSWVSSGIRKSQKEIAQDAMTRAGQAELKLHEIALVLATRKGNYVGSGPERITSPTRPGECQPPPRSRPSDESTPNS